MTLTRSKGPVGKKKLEKTGKVLMHTCQRERKFAARRCTCRMQNAEEQRSEARAGEGRRAERRGRGSRTVEGPRPRRAARASERWREAVGPRARSEEPSGRALFLFSLFPRLILGSLSSPRIRVAGRCIARSIRQVIAGPLGYPATAAGGPAVPARRA